MAPPHADVGKSESFCSRVIQSNEYNMMGLDYFQTDEAEQLSSSFHIREWGAGSPSSLDSAAVASNTAHDTDNCFSEYENSKSFPALLHAIVSDENSDSVIHWLPCGTRFIVANKEEFSRVILSKYFPSGAMATKFTSFTRRLKRWDFSRVSAGREMGAYYHESFIRGEPELAKKIVYPMIKGSSPSTSRASASSAKTAVSKARRRASTGSNNASKVKAEDLLALRTSVLNTANLRRDLDNISPTPAELTASFSLLDDEFTNWLSSAEFVGEELDSSSSSNLDNLFCQEPNGTSSKKPIPVTSVSSNSELDLPKFRPPPAYLDVTPGGRFKIGDFTDLAFPMPLKTPSKMPLKMLRRHSIGSPCTTKVYMSMEMIPSLNNANNEWFDTNQLPFGTKYSYSPHVAQTPGVAVSAANSTSFTSDDVSWTGAYQNKVPPTEYRHQSPQVQDPPQPRQRVSLAESSSREEDSDDAFFRELGFGDVCAIDPFT